MFKDFNGYYAILGVQPNVTPALIKAAYRVRIGELHPDRNNSKTATEETQRLNKAYEVLSDEAKRAIYDRACQSVAEEAANQQHTRSTTGSAEGAVREQTQSARYEPVLCSCCGAITAQPRFRELITVVSWVLSSHKRTRSGIFCMACEKKESAKATGITALLGWWGFYGFFWTLDAFYKNLAGTWRYLQQDAALQGNQALYFFSIGKLDLAHAVALEALDLAMGSGKISTEQRRRAKMGYETQDGMQKIRSAMIELIAHTEAAGQTMELVRRRRVLHPSFLIQAGFVAAVAIAVGMFVWRLDVEQQEREAEHARSEQARLIREGISRQRAQAIAEQQAEELRQLEQPLPRSGIMQRFISHAFFSAPGGLPRLEVTAPDGASYLLKMYDWATSKPVLSVFVRADETIQVRVPFGTYRVRMAAGTTWYGDTVRFGPNTHYSQIDQPMEFSVEGDQLMGHVLKLTMIRNGNLKPSPITADQF